MKKPARRHHTVPKFYVEGFTVPKNKGRLLVFDPGRPPYRSLPVNLTVERDFNRFDHPGVAMDAVEDFYAKTESGMASAIKRTVAAGRFETEEDRSSIMDFVTLLFVRTPRLRDTFGKAIEDVHKLTLDLLTADKTRWERLTARMVADGAIDTPPEVSFESVRAFVESGDFDVRTKREFFISNELRLWSQLQPIVAARKWLVLTAASDCGGYLTCDHPARIVWSDPKLQSGFYGPGLGCTGTELLVPLSKNVALIGAFEIFEGSTTATAEFVAAVNGATITNAERQVYAPSETTQYRFAPDEPVRSCKALSQDHRFRAAPRKSRRWY